MTIDCEIAEAISDGINCLATLIQVAKSGERPADSCLQELDAMARAYADVRAGVVVTNHVPSVDEIENVRRVHTLVTAWLITGEQPTELLHSVEAILDRMGIDLDARPSIS